VTPGFSLATPSSRKPGIIAAEAKRRRHRADDLMRTPVDDDRALEHGVIAAERAVPVAVAEHHHVRRAGPVVRLREPAADRRRHAKRAQHALARRQRPDFLGIALAGHGRGRPRAPDPHVLQGLRVVGVGRVDRVIEIRLIDAADRVHDPHERVGVRVGQRVDQDPVHDAEDRGRGADAEREREDRGSGEAG
jgi:hypothetical protein